MQTENIEEEICQITALLLTIVSISGTILRPLFSTQSIVFTLLGIFNSLLAASIYILIRKKILTKHAGIIISIVCIFCLVPLLIVSGGINSQFIILSPLIPVFCSFICSFRVVGVISVSLILLVLSLFAWSHYLVDLDNEVVATNKQIAKLFWIVVAIIISGWFGYYYQKLNHKLKNALNTFAYMDSLTEIANRRHIEENLETAMAQAKRDNTSLGIMLLDVDKFKQLNDDFGHDVGDECLKFLAKTLESSIRQSDYVGRFGGEEFLLIFPNTKKEDLSILGNKLVTTIANTECIYQNNKYKFTVSIGGSVTNNDKKKSIPQLLKAADEALYKGKDLGRNQFNLYSVDE